jgi:hypothetical protein
MGITLDKIEKSAPELVSMVKNAQKSLDSHGLTNATAKVALMLDHSGSISREYSNGSLQQLAERVLGIGLQLDDDGQIDLFFFDSSAAYAGEISVNDYKGSVDRLRNGRRMGTTRYDLAIDKVLEHYGFSGTKTVEKRGMFGKKKVQPEVVAAAEHPVFVVFLTDGKPDDERAAVLSLTKASVSPVFFKFLSIGRHIDFLQQLDDLDSRFVDNADYQSYQSLSNVSDQKLFDDLLDEYPEWVAEVRSRGLIK